MEGEISVGGLNGHIRFLVLKDDDVFLRLELAPPTNTTPQVIIGNLSGIDALIRRGCDGIATLLADALRANEPAGRAAHRMQEV